MKAFAEPASTDQDGMEAVIGGLPQCRLRRVTAYIDSNLSRELRLAELGAVVHMSPYHFARLFKRATGMSPHRFVVKRRVDAAAALLTGSTTPIAEIARAVGFATASHFATTFRRVTGVTPSAHRTRHGNEGSAIDAPPAEPSASPPAGNPA